RAKHYQGEEQQTNAANRNHDCTSRFGGKTSEHKSFPARSEQKYFREGISQGRVGRSCDRIIPVRSWKNMVITNWL
ncbi:MAG TPA: hypothetical protein VMV59_05290, partial [Candidatus Dormibacteraeota bacterium]|nr:hypothetical protein [Candidatus Dormibacteraeota bacterium]